MAARLNRALNLVIPLDDDKLGRIYVHATPVSVEVFETFYRVMAKALAQIYKDGLDWTMGPRVAYLAVKEIATSMGQWPEVEAGLINEIIRLSMVAVPSDRGWKNEMLFEAMKSGLIADQTKAEVLGQLVFFTLEVSLHHKSQAQAFLDAATGLWGSQLTSLSFTDFMSSLPTSTPAVSSGAPPSDSTPQPAPGPGPVKPSPVPR